MTPTTKFLRRVGWLAAVTLVVVSWPSARADDATARFYEQLRQRQLFGLVESDCLRRLETPSLNERQRSELVLELSRTYAAHAWHTAGAEQDDLWQRASRLIVEHLTRPTATPRRELFETQLALIELGRAEMSLAQSELRPEDRELRQRGLKAVEIAIEQFGVLEKLLGQQVRQNSVVTVPDKLSPFERRTLWQQIRFRLGVARLTQAKLAADIPADRSTALLAADEWLLPLAQGANNERLTWESQLALAEVARWRGDLDRAAKLLSAFEKTVAEDTPLELRERFVIERLRGMLTARQSAEAASWLIEQRRSGVLKLGDAKAVAVASPELAYGQIVVELAVWQLAAERGDAKLAGELWDRLTFEVEQLRRDDGGYWAARAQLDWRRERDVQQFGRELAGLVQKARSGFSTLSSDEAIGRFDAAIAVATTRPPEGGTTNLLLELRDSRATLLFQAKRFEDAAAAFRELAEASRHDRSAATHLLWAFCLGKQFENESTDERRAEFVASLRSLRERYSDLPEAAEAAWLLGQTLERQQQFSEAIGLFATVPESHVRHDEAWAGVARCHEQQVSRLRRDAKPTAEAEAAAIRQLLPVATAVLETFGSAQPRGSEPHAEREITKPQTELLVRLARLLLEQQPADDKAADRLLEFAVAHSRDREWLKLAKQLRVVSLAGQRRIDEAERLIESLEAAGPDELLTLLDGVTAVATRSDVGTQRLVAELQLRASQSLSDAVAKLTEPQRLHLMRARAEALAATGQPTKAIAIYQQLIEKSPRDAKLLRMAAELCESLDSKEATQQAKTFWRRLEGSLKAGGLEWLDARWHVIRCCRRLGEQAEADKLLKVTKLLYPDLGGEAMRARFDEQ